MRTNHLLERAGNAVLDAVFPPRCGVCGAWGAFICQSCEAQLQPARAPRCSRCWRPLDDGERCPGHHDEGLDGIRAGFVYEGVARSLVHGLKYRGLTALASQMAELMAEQVRAGEPGFDAIIPVPLTAARQRTRGHNQAEGLSAELAEIYRVEHLPRALARRGKSPPQARSAGVEERYSNVAGAFVARQPASIEDRSVLLVDDVTTTGATFLSCAATLRAAGAARVVGLAFARED